MERNPCPFCSSQQITGIRLMPGDGEHGEHKECDRWWEMDIEQCLTVQDREKQQQVDAVYALYCLECKAQGPRASTMRQAIIDWNKVSADRGPTVVKTVEVQVAHHIGQGASAVETLGAPRIRIAPVHVPLQDLEGQDLGLIPEFKIEDGQIKWTAMVRDTPGARRALGIDRLLLGPGARQPEGGDGGQG